MNIGLYYNNTRWKIRGRITFRSHLRHFHGRNGLGKVISFHIQDHSGEISVVAFDLPSQLVQDQIEEEKVIFHIAQLCEI